MMLESLARVFELKETSISKKALRRIFISLVLSIPAFPLAILYKNDLLSNPFIEGGAVLLIIVGFLSLAFCMSSRFINRFYFPDKYLDEWETKIKHKSMAFTFMVMFWIVPLLIIALILIGDFSPDVSGIVVFNWGMGFLLALCYTQIFHALWQVRPFDVE